MKRSSSLYTLLLLFFAASVTVVLGDDSASCTSFQINGPTPALFAYHRFYDFRRIRNDDNSLRDSNSSLPDTMAVVSRSVNDSSWTDDWDGSVKPRPAPNDYTYPMQYTTNNVYISKLALPLAPPVVKLKKKQKRADDSWREKIKKIVPTHLQTTALIFAYLPPDLPLLKTQARSYTAHQRWNTSLSES